MKILFLAVALFALGGCNAWTRIQQIGEAPPLTTIVDPTRQPGYTPVEMPMPRTAETSPARQPGSLWQPGTRAFFKDQRASQVGDILTVLIDIKDAATLDNETTRGRDNSERLGIPQLFGFEGKIQKILPGTPDLASLAAADSTSESQGRGSIKRKENIKLRVAATVTQVLPNGNLVVQGRQEIRVNYEVRELQLAGILRPQDISSTNTVPLEKIAEARLSYGGRGQITDVQQPRYGQQLLDILSPF